MIINESDIQQAVDTLKGGGVVVYPTDTVYGLGADIANPDAVFRVRQIKHRTDDKPILALVANIAMLEEYAELTPLGRALAEKYLPGPISLILTARDERLAAVMGNGRAVGFRIPNHVTCARLVTELGRPITSTSLNKAGQPQPRTLSLMLDQIGERADMIDTLLNEGELTRTLPSTVLDVRGDTPVLIREGAIAKEELRDFF